MTGWYACASNYIMEADMEERPFDEYADQFLVNITPYGAAVTFSRTDPKPQAVGAASESAAVGTIRTSLEHLKAMAFVIQRLIKETERNQGVQFQLSVPALNAMQIAPEDWESFWRLD